MRGSEKKTEMKTNLDDRSESEEGGILNGEFHPTSHRAQVVQ